MLKTNIQAQGSPLAVLLKSGTVLILGGPSSDNEIYNPTSGSFTETGSFLTARGGYTAILLNDGTVLVAGGSDASGNILSSAEIYDPTTGQFTTTGSMRTGSESHTAVLVNNGKVLIVGGQNSTSYLSREELYDPVAKTFSLTTSLPTPLEGNTDTLLNDGTVLIASGSTGITYTSATQVFDPANQNLANVNPLQVARSGHTATLLNDGTVLIVGGFGLNGYTVAYSELYAVTPPAPSSVQVTPSTVNMNVGDTQQFTVVSNVGYPRSDVTWTVSDPGLASITSDSSTTLTALAAGTVTLTATVKGVSEQAQITISAAGTTPSPGSTLWSVPSISGFSPLQLAQAMPSATGPSMYSVQLSNDGTRSFLQAMTDDGQQVWQTMLSPLNADSAPDAFGGLLVAENQTCNQGQTAPMSIADFDPTTGQPIWQITAEGIPGAGPDGTTLYCYPSAPQFAVRAADDGAVVISSPGNTSGLPEFMIVNVQTGQIQAEPYIPPSSYTSSDGTVSNGYSPIGQPIVGSDGTTYVEYEVRTISYPPQITAANLYLLQIGTDNSASAVELSSTTSDENLFPGRIIPDGQGGVIATWIVDPSNGQIPSNPYQAVDIVAGSVEATYSLPFTPANFSLGPDGLPLNLSLLLGENGTAFATDAMSSGDRTDGEGPKIVSFNPTSGAVNWTYQVSSTSDSLPLITAISGNGLEVNDFQNGVMQLDSHGNASQITGVLGGAAQSSWNGDWTLQNSQGVSAPLISSITLPDSFWAMPGGNQSNNGGAIEQVQTSEAQGTTHQLPPSDAAPPCLFTGDPLDQPLCSNYSAMEVSTTISPSIIFSTYLQTFLGAQPVSQNDIAQVPNGTNITASGQTVQFTMQGWVGSKPAVQIGAGQGPFKVQIERYDPVANTMSAVTLQGHPIAGWRYWRVYSIGVNEVVVETGAVDTWGPGLKNYVGYWVSRYKQMEFWREYLEFIPTNIVASGLDPNAAEVFGAYPVQGVWNPVSPSQGDILYQVCRASSCN